MQMKIEQQKVHLHGACRRFKWRNCGQEWNPRRIYTQFQRLSEDEEG